MDKDNNRTILEKAGDIGGIIFIMGLWLLAAFCFYKAMGDYFMPMQQKPQAEQSESRPERDVPQEQPGQKKEEGGISYFSPARPFGPLSPAPGSGIGGF